MTIQYCDVSGYAIIVVPGPIESAVPRPIVSESIESLVPGRIESFVPGPGKSAVTTPSESVAVSLYHWRHVVGAWEPTEIELLGSQAIERCPTIDRPDDAKRSKWVYSTLAPALEALSMRVPQGTTIALCFPETVAVLTDYPRDVIDVYCKNYSDVGARRVKFERAVLTGPLDQVFTAPARPHEYMAVYTVKPENVVRIYDRSQSVPKLIYTTPITEVIDVTTEKNQEERVIKWVDAHLSPALDITVDSTPLLVQLYLPTTDLCANPHNSFNSVRDQIIKQLRAKPPTDVTVTLAGSTDNESTLTILDRVFANHNSHLLTSDKYLVTVEHSAHTATVFVDYRSATTAKSLFTEKIPMTNDDESNWHAIKDVLTRAVRTFRDSIDDMTPFLALFVALDDTARKNQYFIDPTYKYFGIMQVQYLVISKTATASGGHDKRVSDTLSTVLRHVIVVDAGSTGTRALAYTWLPPADGIAGVLPNGPFPHPRLPYMKFVGDCEINDAGIHTFQAANVEDYLNRLFVKLDALVAQRAIIKATTPLFALGTGGMRTRQNTAQAAGGQALATYNQLVNRIREVFNTQGFQETSFNEASGDEEAMYGWISANYSLGRLDSQDQPTKGFLEMGGQSMQVAYQLPIGNNDRHMNFTIGVPGLNRVFRVFTKEIDNLGGEEARRRYLIGQRGPNFTIDRCWSLGNALLPPEGALKGTGLCPVDQDLTMYPMAQMKYDRLTESLNPVIALLPAEFRPANHNDLVAGTDFVGGAVFWHATQALYPLPAGAGDSVNHNNMRDLIINHASTPWATLSNRIRNRVQRAVNAMELADVHRELFGNDGRVAVAGDRVALINRRIVKPITHSRMTLFCALVVHASLYQGLGLAHAAQFQPFNGVIGSDLLDPNKKVPYSWTLARAVIFVINSEPPALVAGA